MPGKTGSIARLTSVVALALQSIGIVLIVVSIGVPRFIEYLLFQQGHAITSVVFYLFTLLLIAGVGLLGPLFQGQRWALALNPFVSGTVLLLSVRNLMHDFPSPADLANWLLTTSLFVTALVNTLFGVIAVREAGGKRVPAGSRPGKRSGQVMLLLALTAGWIGMIVLAIAVAHNPPAGAVFTQAPDNVVQVTMEANRFLPEQLNLPVGKTTAVVITNKDAYAHTFVIDALGANVKVMGKTTTMVMVTPPAPSGYEYYCSVPGHRGVGMYGKLTSR